MGLSSSEIGCVVSIMILLCICKSYAQSKVFNIMQFGATPDERTDCSKALSMAWSEACAEKEGGVVLVPAVGRFLVLPVKLQGPCNGFIKLQIDGDLLASPDKAFATGQDWLTIYKVNNLVIDGRGRLVGRGETAWRYNNCHKGGPCHLPITMTLQSINNAMIKNIRSFHSKLFHVSVHGCNDITFDDVTLIALPNSPNTDGIHISKSARINIKNALIATGDDCISLGPGSQDINITNVHCGPGHGISIGSLGKYPNEPNVFGVTVRDTNFSGTTNGVGIKTWSTSLSSIVSNIAFVNLQMNNLENPIIIDQNYCPHGACNKNEVSQSRVQIKGVKYENIRGTSKTQLAVSFNCSQVVPCQDIVLQDINLDFNGNGSSISNCINVRGSAAGPQLPPSCL